MKLLTCNPYICGVQLAFSALYLQFRLKKLSGNEN